MKKILIILNVIPHSNHITEIKTNLSKSEIRSVEEENKLAQSLIKLNIKQPLEFHLTNFKNNNILWQEEKQEHYKIKLGKKYFQKKKKF